MEEVINETNLKVWVYDRAGKGKLCDNREEANELIVSGEYADHPHGPWGEPVVDPGIEDFVEEITEEPVVEEPSTEGAAETVVEPEKKKKGRGKK
jgi:hypothetical protein